MNYVYSARNNAFYPYTLRDAYIASGTWPDDGVDVEESVFTAFPQMSPAGQVRIAGPDGYPAWGEFPTLTNEQRTANAERERQDLLDHANQVIADWRTELSLGIISDDDKASLVKWMQYIKDVKAADISSLPVHWPALPAE